MRCQHMTSLYAPGEHETRSKDSIAPTAYRSGAFRYGICHPERPRLLFVIPSAVEEPALSLLKGSGHRPCVRRIHGQIPPFRFAPVGMTKSFFGFPRIRGSTPLLLCHPERSRGACPEPAEGIWPSAGRVPCSQPDSSTQPVLSAVEGLGMTTGVTCVSALRHLAWVCEYPVRQWE